jgi:hypothetical protein
MFRQRQCGRRPTRRPDLWREHARDPAVPNDDKYADMPPLMDVVGTHADDLFVRDPFSRMTMLIPGLVEMIRGINNS